MGCIWSRGISLSISVDVHTPPEILWTTITDIDNIPSYLSFVKSTKITKHNNNRKDGKDTVEQDGTDIINVYEGLSWEEIRSYNGKDHLMMKTITSIGSKIVELPVNDVSTMTVEKHEQKYIRIHVTSPNKNIASSTERIVNTSSLTVDAIVVENTNEANVSKSLNHCRLIGSVAVIPSFLVHLGIILKGHTRLEPKVRRLLQDELYQTKIEAERRLQKQTEDKQ